MTGYKTSKQGILFFLISVIVLFFSFSYNVFHAVNPDKFYSFQHDSESLVIGRLVKSLNDGIFSTEARLGRYHGLAGDTNENQTQLFLGAVSGGFYQQYDSQIGLQGILFSGIDKLLTRLSITPDVRLNIYHALSAFLFALTLSVIIWLLGFEVGIEAASLVLVTLILSKWQVYMAKNLYWMVFAMFLPMVVVMGYLKLQEIGKKIPIIIPVSLVVICVVIKSSMGYEYISTILIATLAPIVYFAIKNNWNRNVTIRRLVLFGAMGLAGFFLSISLHIYQLGKSKDNYESAISTIKERISARTYADSNAYVSTSYSDSQNASVFCVLYQQMVKGGSFRLKIPYLFWLLYFAYISFKLMKARIADKSERKIIRAMIFTTWFSLLAPLSWFILAKSHTFIHTYINNIVWHLPFMIFGFSVVGLYWKPRLKQISNKFIRGNRSF